MQLPSFIADALTIAILSEASVQALKLPVQVVKVMTGLKRVKPFDCAFCLCIWMALFHFRFDVTAIAATILFRQLLNRLLLF